MSEPENELDKKRPFYEKQLEETPADWDAFVHYRNSGGSRSIEKTAKHIGRPAVAIKKQAADWQWDKRTLPWDNRVDQAVQKTVISETVKMQKRHIALGVGMQGVGAKELEKLQKLVKDSQTRMILNPKEIQLLIQKGVIIERMGRGEAGESVDVNVVETSPEQRRERIAQLAQLLPDNDK